jgi:hypothetical protein
MSQNVLLRAQGLYSFPNRLSSVPSGALLKARNIVINRDNIAESRRGFKLYGSVMGSSSSNTAHQLLTYKGRIFRHWGSGAGTTLDYDSNGTGTFSQFSVVLTGNTTNTDATISNITTTSQLEVGMSVAGTGIPANTTIASITNNTTIELSAAATATNVGTSLTFTWNIAEVETGKRLRSVEQNGNLYFTSSEGIRKISTTSASGLSSAVITKAGGIKALDASVSINNNSGFFTANSVVAYRIVWGIQDSNSNLILGTPSSREVLRNTSASSKTVNITITIPLGITTSYFYQVYRSAVVADPSGDQDPGDELQLVYEANPTNSDLTAGSVSITDIYPELLRAKAANLYTNQNSGEGILQANDIPPLAKDITSFKGYTFYANTSTLQRLDLSLLAISALVSGTSTLTVTDGTTTNTYTFKTQTITCDTHTNTTVDNIASTATLRAGQSISGADFAAGTFIVRIVSATSIEISQAATATTAATTFDVGFEDNTSKFVAISEAATPAQQVDETARSLVRVINAQDSEIVYAYYLSGPSDVPGQILLEARTLSQDAFHLTVNDAATTGIEFNPTLPAAGSSVISNNEVNPNRIYYSKFQQPESVPLLNYLDVGPKDKAIIRILALRDNLFILKEDGVYRLSGLTTPFTVYPFDFSVTITAPDSAVVLNNLIYVYSSQGIGRISDTGVEVISRPIEDEIIKFLIPNYTNFETATFGVAYESDRSYYLFTVTDTTDTYATQCFRYNTFTNTWTKADLAKRCGGVNPSDDKLYLGPTDTNYIEQERKIFDRTDFSDREIALTLGSASVDGTTITLSSLNNISEGDVVVQTQYLTMRQINQLLTKLDRDSLLTFSEYYEDFVVSPGDNLSAAMDAIITAISTDAGRVAVVGSTAAGDYTALTPTPSDFAGQQTTFNSLITLLNADLGVGYQNYQSSSSTVSYEFVILATDSDVNSITSAYEYPLIEGPITIYNHIEVELQWSPQYLQDVSMTKQVSEGTLIFEDSSFSSATLTYATDLSGDVEDQVINGFGNGIFGNYPYGEALYGGNGSGVPFRTYIPREKQRCRYINVGFKHAVARESFALYGCSLTYNPISQRGWRQ